MHDLAPRLPGAERAGIDQRKTWERREPRTRSIDPSAAALAKPAYLSRERQARSKTKTWKEEMPTAKKTTVEKALDDAISPYELEFVVKGVRTFFFNAPNVDAYVRSDERRKAGVKRLQEPDYEEKVWRQEGALALPGSEFIKAMGEMARGFPDPTKSGLKSMRPVIATAFSVKEEFCGFFTRNGHGPEPVLNWDAIDQRLGKLGSTMGPIRRPVLQPGWTTKFTLTCIWPEIFSPADSVTLVGRAGQRGVGDAVRIGMGRFVVVEVSEPNEIAWT